MQKNFKQFMDEVKQCVEKELAEEKVGVSINKVLKNNGIELNALTIKGKSNLSPSIYLEAFYEKYQSNGKMEEIVEAIIKTYDENKQNSVIDIEDFLDFNKVKEKIVYKLVSYEANKTFLENTPHIKILDFAIYFYVMLDMDHIGDCTISIYNNHLAIWKVTKEEVYQLAKENVERLLPAEIHSMRDVLSAMFEEEIPDIKEDIPMFVISNCNNRYGASTIFYKNNGMDRLASELQTDLYILPSSLHECILIPAVDKVDLNNLKDMVQEVNRTNVEPDEKLSDSVYIYERTSKEIKIAE